MENQYIKLLDAAVSKYSISITDKQDVHSFSNYCIVDFILSDD